MEQKIREALLNVRSNSVVSIYRARTTCSILDVQHASSGDYPMKLLKPRWAISSQHLSPLVAGKLISNESHWTSSETCQIARHARPGSADTYEPSVEEELRGRQRRGAAGARSAPSLPSAQPCALPPLPRFNAVERKKISPCSSLARFVVKPRKRAVNQSTRGLCQISQLPAVVWLPPRRRCNPPRFK